jgi:non-ribosomal peptide synthetase component F
MSGSVNATDRRGRRAAPGEIRQVRPLTSAEERHCEQSVPAAFSAQARRTPRALALSDEAAAMTYEELDRASNQVAAGIIGEIEAADEPVAILFREGGDFLVALLGVLKAGKLALPLDLRSPVPALARLIRASEARLLITGDTGRKAGLEVEIRGLDAYQDLSPAHVELPVAPGAGALLLYTSGSTGEPKALCRPHRAMLHHALTTASAFEVGQGTRVGLLLSPAFGTAYGLGFAALLAGGTVLRFRPDVRGLVGLPRASRSQASCRRCSTPWCPPLET